MTVAQKHDPINVCMEVGLGIVVCNRGIRVIYLSSFKLLRFLRLFISIYDNLVSFQVFKP